MDVLKCSSPQGMPASPTCSPRFQKPDPVATADDTMHCSTSGNEGNHRLLKQLESTLELRPPHFYLKRRETLISWLFEVQGELGIGPMVVHSCVLLVDRFASLVTVPESLLQLLLVACLYIAVKLEDEEQPVTLAALSHFTGDTFSPAMISKMETKVLATLDWKVAPATTARFLDIFLEGYEKIWAAEHAQEADLSFMRDRLGKLVDLCIIEPHFLQFRPSLVAAALLYMGHSRIASPNAPWSAALINLTSYTEQDLAICFLSLQRVWMKSSLLSAQGKLDTKSMDTRVSPRSPFDAAEALDSCSESGDDISSW